MFVLVGSDGLFDLVQEDLIADFVGRSLASGNDASGAAQALMDLALDNAAFKTQMDPLQLRALPPGNERRGLVDDISIVLFVV